MGLARLLGVCLALLFATSLNAAQTIDLGPSDWRRWGEGTAHHRTDGLNMKFGQTVRMPPMNTNLTVTRNPVISYGGIANGLKGFARITPASAAVTGLFLAMDWYFDQDSGEWVKDELIETDPVGGSWVTYLHPDKPFPTPLAACQNSWPSVIYVQFHTPTSYRCMHQRGSYGNATGVTYCPEGATINPQTGACMLGAPVPLTDADFGDLASQLPSMPPATVGAAANDAMQRQGGPLSGYTDTTIQGPSSVAGPSSTSTSTDPATGETITTTTSTTTNISYGDTTITTTNTTVTNTYQNGQQTSTTTTTETPGDLPVSGAVGAGWPGFCDWATVVCDWLEWTKEDPPPEQDLPTVLDEDFSAEKIISFGAKSCPPDYQISLEPFLSTPVGVSFQPLCDFAALIYYMVMAASYIIAAYISIGVARSA